MGTPRFRFDRLLVQTNECECPKCGGYKDPNSRICIYCFKRLDHVARKSGLTAQQEEVVKKFVETESIKQVATMMGMRYKTAEFHLGMVRKRLDIATLYGVVRWAFRSGLVSCLVLLFGCGTVPQPVIGPTPIVSRAEAVTVTPEKTMPPGEAMAATYAKNMLQRKSGTITTAVDPIGSGQVSGAGTYPFKSLVTLTAFPNPNWLFSKWQDGSTRNPYVLSVPMGKTLMTAIFTPTAAPPPTNYTVVVGWTPAASASVVGYVVYYGPAPGTYTNGVATGNVTNAAITFSGTNYITAVSLDTAGRRSAYSNEIRYP